MNPAPQAYNNRKPPGFPRLWFCLALVAVIAAVYGQVLHHQFLTYDDGKYVTENAMVREGLSRQGFLWAWSSTFDANWFPLTWLSHMLDFQLFGSNPAGHHLVNVAIHGMNALILFAALARMTGKPWRSAAVAALFALHPLRVESVAWVSERKDVLSALFGLLALYAYCRYAERPAPPRYLAVLLLFLLGLMTKPMLVTLPFLLLLLDFWPLGRLAPFSGAGGAPVVTMRQAWLEKLPLLLLTVASSVLTYLVQERGGAVNYLDRSTFSDNLANALLSYVVYLQQLVWPVKLAVMYPFKSALPRWQPLLAAIFIALVTLGALKQARKRPWFIAGWLWYLGTMVPVIGLVRIGAQAHADRYTYLPLIGIAIIMVWGGAELAEKNNWPRWVRAGIPALAIGACAVLTSIQVGYWRDTVSLFRHALAVTDDNWLARNNLAAELVRQGDYAEGEAHLLEAIRIKPDYASAYANLGIVSMMKRNREQAIDAYRIALRFDPGEETAAYNLGTVLAGMGDLEGAMAVYRQLRQLNPARGEALLKQINMAREWR